MTEIIIDKVHTKFLVKKLKEVFNPIVLTDGIETTLTFNNYKGKGTFSIVTIDNSILNIHFSGVMYETFDVRFYNPSQNALNFIYLQRGSVRMKYGLTSTTLSDDSVQQLIYKSIMKDDEIVSWPLHVETEFNFIKLFDFAYQGTNGNVLDTSNSRVILDANLKPFKDVTAIRSRLIPYTDALLNSTGVGEERKQSLMESIKRLLELQVREIPSDK